MASCASTVSFDVRALVGVPQRLRGKGQEGADVQLMLPVSVIIPVYNRQILGERALRSVLAQNVPAMEVIVVDDGSQPPFRLPDDAAALAHVHLVRHPQNLGVSSARNTGVEKAQGEWIAHLDSDDYWLADTLPP